MLNTRLKYVLTGLILGLVLVMLYWLKPSGLWWRAVEYAAYFPIFFIAVSLLLLYRETLTRKQIIQIAATGMILGGLSLWVYFQEKGIEGYHQNYGDELISAWLPLSILLSYMVLVFIQAGSLFHLKNIDYTKLYRHGWDDFLVLLLAGKFIFAYWLILLLCAWLFRIVGIKEVGDILMHGYFIQFTFPVVFSLGIAIGHEHEKIIGTLRFIALSICRYLLPLTAVISIVFACTLLITGLGPLWSTNLSTHALVWLIVVNLVFINGIYQDGSRPVSYPAMLKVLANLAMLTLAVFSIIAVYSVYLRITQYGLTPRRMYVVIISLVAVLYTFSYLWAVYVFFRNKLYGSWLEQIRTPNIMIAYVVIVLIVLFHSPYMDSYSISARSQFRRALDIQTNLARFDFGVLRFRLGRPGLEKLAQLEKEKFDVARNDKMKRSFALLAQVQNYYEWRRYLDKGITEPLKTRVENFDSKQQVPQELVDTMGKFDCRNEPCKALFIDLDRDGIKEALVVEKDDHGTSEIYAIQKDKSWKSIATVSHYGIDLYKMIEQGKYRIEEPDFLSIVAGDNKLNISSKRQ